MKKIFFNVTACICAGLLFAGCNKEGEDDVNSSGGSGFNGVIEATAVTLPPGLTADEVDIDEVRMVFHSLEDDDEYVVRGGYNNGRFILNLPSIVHEKYLGRIADGIIRGGVKVSDENAKIYDIDDEIRAYKGQNEVGRLYYGYGESLYNGKDDPFAGVGIAMFWYVDSDVNITGSYSEIGSDDNNITLTGSFKFNLSLKEGWNKVYYKQYGDKANNTVSIEFTNTEPSGLTWHLKDYRPK